jgi:hypothetical protein
MTVRRTKRATAKPAPKPTAPRASAADTHIMLDDSALDDALDGQLDPTPTAPPPRAAGPARDPIREPIRMSSADRAALRAQQIFETVDLDLEDDKFALPADLAPEGWEYEWKTYTIIGKTNPGNEVQLARTGWEYVDATRHPEMMPVGYTGPIEREGMRLMERPKIVNDRQRQANYMRAINQVRGQEQLVGVAPKNTMQRHTSQGQPVSKIEREFVSPAAIKNEGFVQVGTPIPE